MSTKVRCKCSRLVRASLRHRLPLVPETRDSQGIHDRVRGDTRSIDILVGCHSLAVSNSRVELAWQGRVWWRERLRQPSVELKCGLSARSAAPYRASR